MRVLAETAIILQHVLKRPKVTESGKTRVVLRVLIHLVRLKYK